MNNLWLRIIQSAQLERTRIILRMQFVTRVACQLLPVIFGQLLPVIFASFSCDFFQLLSLIFIITHLYAAAGDFRFFDFFFLA